MARADDGLWTAMRSPKGQELGLMPQETLVAAEALLAKWGHEPGDRLKADGSIAANFDSDTILEHFEDRYGEEYLEALYGERKDGSPVHWAAPEHTSFHNGVETEALRLLNEPKGKPKFVRLSDALERYLTDNPKAQQPKFARDTTRIIETVYACVGDLSLDAYDREHARSIRDTLAEGRKSATVERRLAILTAVFNHAKIEFSLKGLEPPFTRLPIKDRGLDAKRRLPFTASELVAIASACHRLNDDIRWLIALQLDTGARLGEIVGLRVVDVVLNDPVPHVHIRSNVAIGRTLKTLASERRAPLIGEALWGAQEALKAAKHHGSLWLFPRYASDREIKATFASNTINKWLREHLKIDRTTHSLRHSMKDRLRAAGVPEDLQKALMGHGTKSVADGYGLGFPLGVLKGALAKVALEPEA
jgi:integrase